MTFTPQQRWEIIAPILLKKYNRTKTFLDFRDPWELVVAVVLSAQMTDEGVNNITPALFKKFKNVRAFARADVLDIAKMVRGVNYFNSKAKYLKRSAEKIVAEYGGRVPDTAELLQTLPGVGRKSAVAILANGFKKYIGIPVDTHVIRFAHRFTLSRHRDATKIEQDLLNIIPKKDWNRAGYAIKEYGRKEGRARGYKKELDPLWQAMQRANFS